MSTVGFERYARDAGAHYSIDDILRLVPPLRRAARDIGASLDQQSEITGAILELEGLLDRFKAHHGALKKASQDEFTFQLAKWLNNCHKELTYCLRGSNLGADEFLLHVQVARESILTHSSLPRSDDKTALPQARMSRPNGLETSFQGDSAPRDQIPDEVIELVHQWDVLNDLTHNLQMSNSSMKRDMWLERAQPIQEANNVLRDVRERKVGHPEAELRMDRAQKVISALILRDPVLRSNSELFDTASAIVARTPAEPASPQRNKPIFMHYTISEDRCGNEESVRSALLASLGKREPLDLKLAMTGDQPLRLP